MPVRSCLKVLLSICVAASLAGCGSNVDVATISITPSTQSLAAGQTAQFTATGTIPHGQHPATTVDVTSQVTWKSNATAIATISATGLATAISAGTATITADMAGASSASATITVTGGTGGSGGTGGDKVASLTVIPGSQSVASPSDTSQFLAIGTTASGATEDLTNQATWSSSSAQIATVGAGTGLATAVSQGTATITAIHTNADKSVATGTATFMVLAGNSEPVTALKVYPNSQSTTALDQQTQFFVLGTEGSSGLQFDETGKVDWSSSNPAVATIGTAGRGTPGLATSVGPGTTTITATYTNPDGSKIVATADYSTTTGTAQEPLLSINIVPADVAVSNKGMTAQYLAFGTYSSTPTVRDITNSVTWVSTLPEVASVNSSGTPGEYAGLVTAQGYTGSSIIYAIDNTTNSDGTVVLSNPQTFTCMDSLTQVCNQTVPTPQFATITLFIQGEQTASSGEYVTAPSDTGTLDLIHCGREYAGTGGQVCTGTYAVGSKVTLTENLADGSTYFGGWSTGSGCVDPNNPSIPLTLQQLQTSTTCTVVLSGNASVGVIFY